MPAVLRRLSSKADSSEFELHKKYGDDVVSASRATTHTESKLLEIYCEVSTVIYNMGSHFICQCWSTMFYLVQSQRSHLTGDFRRFQEILSADKPYGNANFLFQQDLAS